MKQFSLGDLPLYVWNETHLRVSDLQQVLFRTVLLLWNAYFLPSHLVMECLFPSLSS